MNSRLERPSGPPRKRWRVALMAALACLAGSAQAQILVPAGGINITFDTAPVVANWATHVLPGNGGTYTTVAELTAGVQTLSAASIATTLPTSATWPPSTSSLGYRYNTTMLLVQSRPTTSGTNAANVLKATLVNQTGVNAAFVTISYDFDIPEHQGGADELPGWYAFYSLTGAAGSWVAIPEFSGVDVAGRLTATINLSWPAGSTMYILWADDNDNGDTDSSYTMDNVFITASDVIVPTLRITAPAEGATIPEYTPIGVTTFAQALTGVRFLVDGSLYSDDTTEPYTATVTGLAQGTHTLTAFGTNNVGAQVPAQNNPVTFTVGPPAAIVVPAEGAGPFPFDVYPAVSDGWSTHSIGGGSGDYPDVPALDAAIQATPATSIVNPLGTSAADPPGTAALAQWSSAGLYVQTRPTGNGATLFMATLYNNIGGDANTVTVNYDLTEAAAPGGEMVAGHRVYYSLTGAADSWVVIPEVSGDGTTGPKSFTLDLSGTPWPSATLMYLLWVDPNAVTNPDGIYQLDNFFFHASGATVPPFVGIRTPTEGAAFNECVSIPVNTIAAGLTGVRFMVDGIFNSSDTTPPYSTTLSGLTVGQHQLTAFGTNNTGGVVAATNNPITFTVTPNTAPSITITNPPQPFSVLVGTAITNQVNATDDVAVVSVDWYVDDELYYTRSNANWEFVWSDSLEGTHTIRVVAYDACGASANHQISVLVTNPPTDAFQVLLSNGTDWRYYAGLTEPPSDGSGNQWYNNPFYDFAGVPGWSNGVSSLGNGNRAATPGQGGQPADAYYPCRTEIDIGPAGARYSAVYFQTEFNIPDDPNTYLGLRLRLLRDDGAVVYINSFPVMTNNMTPTAIPAAYGDPADGAAADDGQVYQDLFIPGPLDYLGLQSGLNVVAVEVHQSSLTSSDLNFDLMIWNAVYNAPTVTIVNPINGSTVGGGCSGGVTIPVDVSASTYVTNVTVFVDGAQAGQSGTAVGGVFTVNATGVAQGTHVLTAQGIDSFGAVSALSPGVTITVLANQLPTVAITDVYSGGVTSLVWRVGTALTNAIAVSDPDGTVTNLEFLINGQLWLTRANNFTPVITIDALAGTSVFQAVAVDDCGNRTTSAPVTVTVTNPPSPISVVVSNGSSWRFFNLGSAPPADGLGRPWTDPNYDANTWPAGLGELGGGDGTVAPPNTVQERTVIDIGPAGDRYHAIYFRHEFQVGNAASITSLIANGLQDDGAVAYLNGTPIYTNNMPAGPYTYDTFALGAIADDGTIFHQVTASSGALISGKNVLAVEVHQNGPAPVTSSDLSFDFMLWGQGGGGPTLQIALVDDDGNPFTPPVPEVRWSAAGATLIQSADITAPRSTWSAVPGATSGYRPPVGTQMFYALRIP